MSCESFLNALDSEASERILSVMMRAVNLVTEVD